MRTVFISYRHVSPDQELAQALASTLRKRGSAVFLDTEILVGMRWAGEIERNIRSSDFFVVILSRESILSDMVRQEVKLAYDLSKNAQKRFTILPVRVGFTGELPYDLGAYLDAFQFALWMDGDFEPTIELITTAIEQSVELPNQGKSDMDTSSAAGITELKVATEARGAPLPSSDYRFETGAIKLDSPFYVRRKADSLLERQVNAEGTTTVVKGTRQMGKSSLLARAYALMRDKQKAFYLDFQLVDRSQLENMDSLASYLAHKFARKFKAAIKPEQFWDDTLGGKENLTDYFEEAILAESRVIMLFDEVDLLFDLPYRDQFFATIRAWHNLRATRDIWNRLNIVIAHSTEPYLWIQNINQSPFNVGQQISLNDFSAEQIRELDEKYGGLLKTETNVQRLVQLVGGHPFLVRQALFTLASSELSMTQLENEATEMGGPFGDHLKGYLYSLQLNGRLKGILQNVLRHKMCDDEIDFQRLKAAGLVKGETRHALQMRCQLYEDYFNRHL